MSFSDTPPLISIQYLIFWETSAKTQEASIVGFWHLWQYWSTVKSISDRATIILWRVLHSAPITVLFSLALVFQELGIRVNQ